MTDRGGRGCGKRRRMKKKNWLGAGSSEKVEEKKTKEKRKAKGGHSKVFLVKTVKE